WAAKPTASAAAHNKISSFPNICSHGRRTGVRCQETAARTASTSFAAPKRTGSSAASPVSASAAATAARASSSSSARVLSAIAASRAPLDDEPLGRAREEVRDDGVDRYSPPGDDHPGLAGRDEDRAQAAPARLEVELARDGHLPDRAVGADGEDDRRIDREVL